MATIVPAVASSVRIIERLAADWPEAVSPRDLVQELDLNRSTCYNLLSTLQQAGWVRSLGERAGWTLGPRLLTLTGVTEEVALKVMQEEINALSREIGFVVFITEPDGAGRYVVIAKAEQRLGVRVTVGIGQQFHFSAPALMNAFHAWSAEREFDQVVKRIGITRFTERTLTDLDEVRAELDRTRARGYSVSLQQFDTAQSGVGAPIFGNRDGTVSHVITSLSFSSELNAGNADRIGKLLAECGARITERVGGRLPALIDSI